MLASGALAHGGITLFSSPAPRFAETEERGIAIMGKIRVAINGYGNLGRGVEKALAHAEDMELLAVFTRRAPETVVTAGAPVVALRELPSWVGKIDVVINCGGSATDLETQTPQVAEHFNVVDSFDNHAHIPAHFAAVDATAKEHGTLALISSGWDPGFFSLQRAYGLAFLPAGETYTFWGPGLSQGHSDAVRRISGVKHAVQYTLPVEENMQRILAGEKLELSTAEKHRRQVFVVLEEGADADAVREAIVTMPDYFAPYETEVNFISEAEFARDHTGMPHGGHVIRIGETTPGTTQVVHGELKLDSNPEFTGSVLAASARAVARMAAAGATGAITLFDVPPAQLVAADPAELRQHWL
ncbi:diaminopimelate dehydrogenase [Actinobaculum suis]|uniref:Meso-diaminopimelate D-dehydrogenase n=2 Tax=Actinobaculum suis TaxID=1657 RepID=A0A1G7A1U5_9ACTO|nr:diaminopimelate dehydrogenase [Actinobaculum suis]